MGKTILGVGVEETQLPEVALDRGRRLELFLADETTSGKVEDRVQVAFKKRSTAAVSMCAGVGYERVIRCC